MPAVPMPDADSQQTLHAARVDAHAALDTKGEGVAPPVKSNYNVATHAAGRAAVQQQMNPPNPADNIPAVEPGAAAAGASAQPSPIAPSPTPGAAPAVAAPPQSPDLYASQDQAPSAEAIAAASGPNAAPVLPGFITPAKQILKSLDSKEQPADADSFWDSAWDVAKYYAAKAATGINEGAKAASNIGAGVLAEPLYLTGTKGGADLADNLFKAVDSYYAPALANLKGATASGDQGNLGGVAQTAGNVIQGLAPLAAGPEAFAAANIGQTGQNAIDQNQDLRTAFTLTGVSTIVNQLFMGLPGATNLLPARQLLKTLFAGVSNVPLSVGQEYATKYVLQSNGYKEAADKIDPLDPSSIIQSGLLGVVMSVLGAPDTQLKLVRKGFDLTGIPKGPSVESILKAQNTPADQIPPPPASPEAPAAAAPAAATPGAEPNAIEDKPSAESAADLRAQLRDMNDPKTPRTGVLVSDPATSLAASNEDTVSIRGQLKIAFDQGRVVQTETGGLLITKTAAIAKQAIADLKNGVDPQYVIGKITGAGGGKEPGQTAVVQGQDTQGNVATESMVKPEEVPAAVQKVTEQGKTPVVTTPEAAIARREATIAVEQAGTQVDNAVPETGTTEPSLGMFKPTSGEPVAVRIESGAEEGKIRVRPLDDQGEPTERTIDVPAEQVTRAEKPSKAVVASEQKPSSIPAPVAGEEGRTVATEQAGGGEPAQKAEVANAEPEATAPESKPKAVAPKTALESLPEALEAHESQEQIPEGRKFAASLAERQDNASAFAAVLKAAASESKGRAPDADVQRATAAAKAAEGLTNKSKEATDKGQGTGHGRITALVDEMHRAARVLLGKAEPGDEELVVPKQEALKAKISYKAAKAKEAPAESAEKTPPAKEATTVAEPKKAAPKPADRTKTQSLVNQYTTVEDPAKARTLRDKIEMQLRSAGGKEEDVERLMDVFDNERQKNVYGGGRSMSETVEEEPSVFDPESLHDANSGMAKVQRPSLWTEQSKADQLKEKLQTNVMHKALAVLGDRVTNDQSQAARELRKFFYAPSDSGVPASLHTLLRHLWVLSDNPIHAELFQHLLETVPDYPVFLRDQIAALSKGDGALLEHAAGLFHPKSQTLQIKDLSIPRMIETLIHEATHTGTAYFMESKPHDPLTMEVREAHDILLNRLNARYGKDVIDAHIAYFRRKGPKPDNYIGAAALYGATDPFEMLAEVQSNPAFMQEVAESEDWRAPGENIPEAQTLLGKIWHAIGKMLGTDNPTLLSYLADLNARVGKAQAAAPEFRGLMTTTHEGFVNKMADRYKTQLGVTAPEMEIAERGLMSLRDEPPTLPHGEVQMRKAFNDDEEPKAGGIATQLARSFDHVVKGKAPEALRTISTGLQTVAQLFRNHMADFGGESDPENPLRVLQESDMHKNEINEAMSSISRPVAEAWLKLPADVSRKLGQLMIDTTTYRIDPRKDGESQSEDAQTRDGFEDRLSEYQKRLQNLPPEAREVYSAAADANGKLLAIQKRAAIDVATSSVDPPLTPAQKSLLYSVKTKEGYDSLIGKDKLVDLGENNDKVLSAVKDLAGTTQMGSPYFHLGRLGDYVVSAKPEGTREFANEGAAREFEQRVNELSPDSKGTTEFRDGKWVVDYKARYVSMHETRADAEAAQGRMRDAGFDVGHVTQKTYGKDSLPPTGAMGELLSEAERKINRNGQDEGTEALIESLRSAYLHMMAARSAFAASRLARKNFAGVKPEEMMRNFAEHALSTAWHTSQMRTVFERASALAKVRAAARDSEAEVSQNTMYRRGTVVDALGRHMRSDVQDYGHKAPFNSMMAKLGFMNFLASPSHAFIWMTQNFSAGLPVAGARWGYGKATMAFGRAMKMVSGPAFRSTMQAIFSRNGNSSDIQNAIIQAIRRDPVLGKWAQGDNSHIQQLINRGVLNHGYSNQLGAIARGDNARVARVFEWARLLPSMADAFNRVSTALAGLEMTGGDIRKTADFVDEIHADYSQGNKPLAFKALNRVPGLSSVTMFKTYVQAMAHLTYSNFKATLGGNPEAAKTLAGLVVANSLFVGVYGAAALEPLRLALYAYHKVADQEGSTWDLKNTIHQFLVQHFGTSAGNVMAGGLPHMFGYDLSSRMGLADLFFHNPPDLLTTDTTNWKNFMFDQMGTMPSMLAHNVTSFLSNWKAGHPWQAISSIIPVKAFQDAITAYQYATQGKQTTRGGQQTPASGLDAFYKAMGLKPASVADAQEKQGYKSEYFGNVKQAKQDILTAFLSAQTPADRVKATNRINTFNKNFPAEAIKSSDLRQGMKYQQETNLPTRDENVNKATDF